MCRGDVKTSMLLLVPCFLPVIKFSDQGSGLGLAELGTQDLNAIHRIWGYDKGKQFTFASVSTTSNTNKRGACLLSASPPNYLNL